MWKFTYGLAIVKEGEQEPFKVKDDEEDDNNEGKIEGGTKMNIDDQATTEKEQQQELSVQDTQLPNVSPKKITSVSTKTIIVEDVFDLTAQNINPLIEEDLKKILDQSTLQAELCDNSVLVSVDEIQKSVTKTIRKEVKT